MRTCEPILLCTDDQSLARQARAGDSVAMEVLVRRWQVPLIRFLQRKVGSPADAEDLFQETCVRVYRSLDSFDDRKSFKTWIFTIAWRLAANHLRGRKANQGEEVLQEIAQGGKTPYHRLAERDEHRNLWEVARGVLKEEAYTMLWLFYVEQLSPREIAQVTNRSWVSVKTALHRARKTLAPYLDHLRKDGVV